MIATKANTLLSVQATFPRRPLPATLTIRLASRADAAAREFALSKVLAVELRDHLLRFLPLALVPPDGRR